MRSYPALLAMLASLASCAVLGSGCASADSDSLVLLRIGGDATGVHQLRVTARLLGSAERTSTPALLPAQPETSAMTLSPPRRFALRNPVGVLGPALLLVEPLDESGDPVGTAVQTSVIQLSAGKTSTVDVCLGTCTMAFDDAGMPDSGMMSADASRPLDGSTGVDAMTAIDAAVTSVDSGTPTCASCASDRTCGVQPAGCVCRPQGCGDGFWCGTFCSGATCSNGNCCLRLGARCDPQQDFAFRMCCPGTYCLSGSCST